MSMSIDLGSTPRIPSPTPSIDPARSHLAPFVSLLGLDSTEGLSAEYLVMLAQQRLGTIDNQLKSAVDLMNQKSQVLGHLRAASTRIEEWRSAHHGTSDEINFDETFDLENADGTTLHTTLRKELEDAGINVDALIHDHHSPDVNNLEGLTTTIRNQTESLQQGSEIDQMRLQQLVQSRGQFVQMCSQIMSSMHETEKGVVSNIRG